MAPSDRWALPPVILDRREAALAVLQEPQLLESFFDRLLEVITLIEANSATAGFDSTLAWDMLAAKQLNVLVYGESGAGKSLLVRTLTGDAEAQSSHVAAGTTVEQAFKTACGINFVDTPGIKIPQAEMARGVDGTIRHLRDRWTWWQMLRDLDQRLQSSSAAERPLALVYVHRASHRVIKERIVELVTKAHERLVPTFLLLSDVCGVDDAALAEVRAQLKALVASVGQNKRNHLVHLIEVNSETKTVSGHAHKSRGLPQLVSTLLSNLDPLDALTFTRRRSLLALGALMPAAHRPRTIGEAEKAQVRAKRQREGGAAAAPAAAATAAAAPSTDAEGDRPARRRRTM